MQSATTHPAAQYTISFNANGGSLSGGSSATATLGCALPDCVSAPTRNGYTFNGWRTESSGGTQYYSATGAKSLSSFTSTANVTLYAQWEKMPILSIASQYGTCSPFNGEQPQMSNTVVNASVATPADENGVRHVCTGWTGTGSVPANGTATNVAFTITEDSTLTWNWKTQYRIAITATGAGSCSFGTQWVDDGTTVTATIAPTSYLYTISLSGNTDGVTLNGTMLSIPSNQSRSIIVTITEMNLSITDVTAQQRYPWNGKVDISYTVSGNVASSTRQDGMAAVLKVSAADSLSNQTHTFFPAVDDTALANGSHSLVWDMEADGLTFVSASVVFSVSFETVPENNYDDYLSGNAPPSLVTTLCANGTTPMPIDLTPGTRTAALTETIRYSTAWDTNAVGATAEVAVNGETLSSATGSGVAEWQPTHNGTYTLTHKVMNGDTQVGATLTATFEVSHFPATPVISPVGGVVASWPVTVTISCATEGATIHYTTDGTDPTADSPVYRRFRISERTTVKAIAVKDGLVSEIAVAEYALGQCADPVITPVDGTDFEHSGQSVSIAWSGEDGVLRYTLDGSDPTAESPAYVEPFTIDETTVVKAKAFGDQFFDSAIVTAALTRAWVNVATPTITAAASFTGSKTKVALSCATEGSTIRYTLNGNDPNSHATRYTGPFYVTDSCTVKAYAVCADYLNSEMASFIIEKVWGIGDTLGVPDQIFTIGGDLPFVRVTDATAPLGESMKSGAITHSQTSTLYTTVTGPGTVSFQWKTSCEDSGGEYDWDHAEFKVDGSAVAKLDGETAWQTVSHDIAGDGTHTLEWRYVKDDVESEGGDCCWVADFHWTSAVSETQTTEVPVPYDWLRDYYPETPDEYDSYEVAANATAANGVNKVWECYVAGISPTNAMQVFHTMISWENGEPKISWEPDLNEDGAKHERVYRVLGAKSLDLGAEWDDVTDLQDYGAEQGYRFFRVKVELP